METIKIRLGSDVVDRIIYSYIEQEYDESIDYYTGYTLVPLDSEVTEESPEYIKISVTIYTATTTDSGGISEVSYYKKQKYLMGESLRLFLPMSNTYETNLYQEELINDMFVNDIKASVIPDMIDMEKVVFTPAFQSNTSVYDAKEIVFNFHFSERNKDNGWQLVTGNTSGWNNIGVGTKLTSQILRKSDKLGFLGFDDDDVRYQTNRLKKSFVRLSYYTTNNPLDQKLLTYNTMFMDVGELYGKFMNNRVDTPDFGVNTDDEPDSTNSNRLDSRLTIVDKNNINKSSEGFYLYLFNDEVTEKSPEKDIYMKVEFNSAAYGLTVPVCKPYCDNSGHIKPTPFDEFFNSLFIRIKLKYIASEKRFVYIIPEDGLTTQVDIQNRRIIFNLFEVKFDDNE